MWITYNSINSKLIKIVFNFEKEGNFPTKLIKYVTTVKKEWISLGYVIISWKTLSDNMNVIFKTLSFFWCY